MTICNLGKTFGVLALLAVSAATQISEAAASPPTWLSANQITASEAQIAPNHFSSAVGWQLEIENSPNLSLSILLGLVNSTSGGKVITEDGAISPSLLPVALTPSVTLTDSSGKAVTIGETAGIPVSTQSYTLPSLDQNLEYFTGNSAPAQPPLYTLLPTTVKCFLRNPARFWMEAPAGTGSLFSAWVNPGAPDQYQLVNIDTGGSVVRPYDHIALKARNGRYVTSSGGQLSASAAAIGAKEAFRVNYLTSYMVASQVAEVSGALVYHEFNDTVPQVNGQFARDWTLSPGAIQYSAAQLGRAGGVIVLARSYTELSENPPYLPGHAAEIRNAVACGQCAGVEWELLAGNSDTGQPLKDETLQGIAYCATSGKKCYVMLAPHTAGNIGSAGSYVNDVAISINRLRSSAITASAYSAGKIQIVLAAYDRSKTGVHFLGTDGNSVEAAFNWVIKHG